MGNVWLVSALWLGLALLALIISIRIAISIAPIEIIVGAFASILLSATSAAAVDIGHSAIYNELIGSTTDHVVEPVPCQS